MVKFPLKSGGYLEGTAASVFGDSMSNTTLDTPTEIVRTGSLYALTVAPDANGDVAQVAGVSTKANASGNRVVISATPFPKSLPTLNSKNLGSGSTRLVAVADDRNNVYVATDVSSRVLKLNAKTGDASYVGGLSTAAYGVCHVDNVSADSHGTVMVNQTCTGGTKAFETYATTEIHHGVVQATSRSTIYDYFHGAANGAVFVPTNDAKSVPPGGRDSVGFFAQHGVPFKSGPSL